MCIHITFLSKSHEAFLNIQIKIKIFIAANINYNFTYKKNIFAKYTFYNYMP